MILLLCFWVIFTVYWVSVVTEPSKNQAKDSKIQNLVATVADACFLWHDWLLTEKFLSACLMLPVVQEMVNKTTDALRFKKRAELLYKGL